MPHILQRCRRFVTKSREEILNGKEQDRGSLLRCFSVNTILLALVRMLKVVPFKLLLTTVVWAGALWKEIHCRVFVCTSYRADTIFIMFLKSWLGSIAVTRCSLPLRCHLSIDPTLCTQRSDFRIWLSALGFLHLPLLQRERAAERLPYPLHLLDLGGTFYRERESWTAWCSCHYQQDVMASVSTDGKCCQISPCDAGHLSFFCAYGSDGSNDGTVACKRKWSPAVKWACPAQVPGPPGSGKAEKKALWTL